MGHRWIDSDGNIADIDACIDAAQGGDRPALEALIIYCAKRIRSVVWLQGRFRNREDIDDATQEALIKITAIIRQFGRRSAICTWMCGVARNTTRDIVRKRTRANRASGPIGHEGIERHPDPHANHEERLAQHDLVQRVLDSLDPQLRETCALKYIEGLSDSDIADRLYISPVTVRTRLTTVRRRIHLIIKGGANES